MRTNKGEPVEAVSTKEKEDEPSDGHDVSDSWGIAAVRNDSERAEKVSTPCTCTTHDIDTDCPAYHFRVSTPLPKQGCPHCGKPIWGEGSNSKGVRYFSHVDREDEEACVVSIEIPPALPQQEEPAIKFPDWMEIINSIQNTDYAKENIKRGLLSLTDDQRRSLFRALMKSAAPIAALLGKDEPKLPEMEFIGSDFGYWGSHKFLRPSAKQRCRERQLTQALTSLAAAESAKRDLASKIGTYNKERNEALSIAEKAEKERERIDGVRQLFWDKLQVAESSLAAAQKRYERLNDYYDSLVQNKIGQMNELKDSLAEAQKRIAELEKELGRRLVR